MSFSKNNAAYKKHCAEMLKNESFGRLARAFARAEHEELKFSSSTVIGRDGIINKIQVTFRVPEEARGLAFEKSFTGNIFELTAWAPPETLQFSSMAGKLTSNMGKVFKQLVRVSKNFDCSNAKVEEKGGLIRLTVPTSETGRMNFLTNKHNFGAILGALGGPAEPQHTA